MLPSIAGATTIGDLVAKIVAPRGSSEIPFAILPMLLAVAGATTTMSAFSASATWLIDSSDSESKRSVTTGRCVRLLKARGDIN